MCTFFVLISSHPSLSLSLFFFSLLFLLTPKRNWILFIPFFHLFFCSLLNLRRNGSFFFPFSPLFCCSLSFKPEKKLEFIPFTLFLLPFLLNLRRKWSFIYFAFFPLLFRSVFFFLTSETKVECILSFNFFFVLFLFKPVDFWRGFFLPFSFVLFLFSNLRG